MKHLSRLLAVVLGLALAGAGTPVSADPCGSEASCPMMVASGATHDCCQAMPSHASLMVCCTTRSAAATAPLEIGVDLPAAAVVDSVPAQTDVDDSAPSPQSFLTAERARAELRHELGLFVLFAAFLN